MPWLENVQRKLNYVFREPSLIHEALTHRSFLQTDSSAGFSHNERLEFLGDAVLGLVVSETMTHMFPDFSEGELSRVKARLISRPTLATASKRLDLGSFLRLGRGEEVTQGREKHSLLANALEAVIGAMYIDGGLSVAKEFIHLALGPEFSGLRDSMPSSLVVDWKSRLQEWAYKHFATRPRYVLVGESGPDHQKTFEMTVTIQGKTWGKGQGHTKKEAEQHAAEQALMQLRGDSSPDANNSHV